MNRNIACVSVSENLLIETMTQGWTTRNRVLTCIKGLPEDAKYAGASFDARSLNVLYFFTHPSFTEVPEGAEIPQFNIIYESTTGGIYVK